MFKIEGHQACTKEKHSFILLILIRSPGYEEIDHFKIHSAVVVFLFFFFLVKREYLNCNAFLNMILRSNRDYRITQDSCIHTDWKDQQTGHGNHYGLNKCFPQSVRVSTVLS